MEGSTRLPRPSDLSPSLIRFLADRFVSAADLSCFPDLERELRNRCSALEASLSDLGSKLSDTIAAYASHSDEVGQLLSGVKEGLTDLRSQGSPQCAVDEEDFRRSKQILVEELPALAKEVARVETVRAYAETALQLDRLIGDVEDAVSSSVAGKLRSPRAENSKKTNLLAINALKDIDDILLSVRKTRPQWARLISAVDHRVDRALAVLRPQAIANHRSLLVSLGWPPPLSGSTITNPLFSMKGDLQTRYSESFLSLCNLQEVQRRRKSRQLEGHHNLEILIRQPLWVIEELASPIFMAAHRHFAKWVEKPEFVFALIYKITRDFVESMDEILQPLVDKANLVGYSCREEWISTMVAALSTYLSKEIFSQYIDLLQGSNSINRILWLNLIDLMISFDKQTRTLIASSGLLMSVQEEENLQRISTLSVFCDRPDWLEIWAEIEKMEMIEKLKSAMQDERSWNARTQGTVLMIGPDDCRSPAVAGAVLQGMSLLIDRARSLPTVDLRARFIRLAVAPVVIEFLDCMLRRCQEAEGLTALADNDALLNVSWCINASRHCESTLTEWCEDIFFIEMESFDEEINRLKEFRIEWVDKISTVVLRGFDARARDYLKNKKQWQEEKVEGGLAVSPAFVNSLDYIRGKMSMLEDALNALDFVTVWRGVAKGIDQLLFNAILVGNVKFRNDGVERLVGDLDVLFGVFAAWCLRPRGFFAKMCEGCRVLQMKEELKEGGMVEGKERWLKDKGIRHLNVAEFEKIIKNRVFSG